MKILNVLFYVIYFVLISANIFAQESEQSIEQLYLQSSLKTRIIKTEAESYDRDMKMIALADIEKMLSDGVSIDDNPEIFDILSDLAGEGVTNIVREQGHIENNFPEIRREAVRILGQIGTEEAAREISNVLYTDYEPMVLSEAVLVISTIEVEDTIARNRSMSAAIYRQSTLFKDNNFAYTYLQAIENIAKREGNIGDPMLLEEIIKLSDARQGFNRVVQKRAFDLLRELQNL